MNVFVKRKQETTYAAIYMLIMAAAMFTTYHIFGYNYKSPDIVRVLVYFEALMTVFTVSVYKKFFQGQAFGKLRLTGSLIIYSFIMVVVLFLYIKSKAFEENRELLTFILTTNIFVGFSEELMYRGIVLPGLLKRYERLKAVMISAFMFSLLHSVNILGGFEVTTMLMQLVTTFIYGLFAGCLFLQIKSIVPLMMYHALWDTVIMSETFICQYPRIIFLVMVVEIIITIVCLMKMYNKPDKSLPNPQIKQNI